MFTTFSQMVNNVRAALYDAWASNGPPTNVPGGAYTYMSPFGDGEWGAALVTEHRPGHPICSRTLRECD